MVQEYESPVRVYKWPFELVMKVSLTLYYCKLSNKFHMGVLKLCPFVYSTLYIFLGNDLNISADALSYVL